MTQSTQRLQSFSNRYWKWILVALVLGGSAVLGLRASRRLLLLLAVGIAGGGGIVLARRPRLGLFGLVAAALVVPLKIPTGTEVVLNTATLLPPALFCLWLADGALRRKFSWMPSRVNLPLMLFLLSGLVSLLLGNALWDPAIPKSGNFWLVQLAQLTLFVVAALALWLMANLIQDQVNLQRLVQFYLLLAGVLAILYVIPGVGVYVNAFTSGALSRSTFWVLLTAIAGGQLLFNHALSSGWRLFLVCVLAAVLFFAFYWEFHTLSTWGPVVVVWGILAWLRWANFRRAVLFLSLIALFSSGLFFSALYELAGGDTEWEESGGSRLVLIGRVIEVTMRNPITGLGPAAYRPYVNARPLQYGRAFWIAPLINSHNNYVDLFSQTGLLGLGIFFWFAVEMGLLSWRLSKRHPEGFVGGYVNGMFAAWIASLVLMMLADWILPFVYNIGFHGFQASVLVWLFLGGVLAVEHWASAPAANLPQKASLR